MTTKPATEPVASLRGEDPTAAAAVGQARATAHAALRPLAGWYRRRRVSEMAAEVWAAVGRAGVLRHVVPADHGGTGAGLAATAAGIEELAAVGLGSMLPVLTACDALAVARHGGDALRRRVLPAVAAAETGFCLAMTEREAGVNTFRTATRAVRRGDHFRVDGSKVYVSGADVAGAMLLLVRTTPREECAARGLPKTAGLSFLWLPVDAPGTTLTPLPTRGEGDLRQFEVHLDGVEIPAENLVGEEGGGLRVLLDLINPERLMISALLVGTARHCLEVAAGHARERRVFGDDPIGSYQSIQHPLAEVWARQQAVAGLVERGVAAFDAGRPARQVGLLANAGKLLAGELGRAAVEAALHALGGRGLDETNGIVHLLELVHLLEVAPIGRGMLLNFIAEQALGLPSSYRSAD